MNTATSPNDIHDIELLRQRLISAERLLVGKSRIIEKQEEIIAQLAQRHWGRSSEKHPGQSELSLFNEAELASMQASLDDDETDDADTDDSPDTADNDRNPEAAPAKPKKPRKRRVLPDHLERYGSRMSLTRSIVNRPAAAHGFVSARSSPNRSG